MSKIKGPIFWKMVSEEESLAEEDLKPTIIAAKHNFLDSLILIFLKAIGIPIKYSPARIISSTAKINNSNLYAIDKLIKEESIDITLSYRLKNLYYYLDFTRPEFVEFFKFGIVGVSGIFVDLIVVTILKENFILDVRLCSVLSFPFAVTSNYLFNHYWTFRYSGTPNFFDYVKFFFANLIGLAVRIWSIHLLLMVAPKLGQVYYLAITMFGILIAFFINFLTSKFLIFNKK